jgi:uncharacterized protein (DUF2267 family)
MTHTGLKPFDTTLQITHAWLNDLQQRMGWEDPHRAYFALRAVLHVLRDRLTVEQAAALAAQLPLLVRGIFYEGWHPHGKPLRVRHREEFLAQVAKEFPELGTDVDTITRAVLEVLSEHLASGEVEKLKQGLPEELRSLWP